MPFTFFAHQVFVAPLKLARPRWFDGTALCIGSMAPDLAYAVDGTSLAFASHSLPAQLLWSVPVTIVLTLCWRHVAARPLGAHLPGRLGNEVRALAQARRPLVMTASSALVGALSHVFVDGFTHPGGWAVARMDWLRRPVVLPGNGEVLTATLLQYLGHVLGTAAGVALLIYLISTRRLSAWSEPTVSSPVERDARWFWFPVAIGFALAVPAALSALHGSGGLPTAVIRAAWVTFGGVMAGSSMAGHRSPAGLRRRSSSPER
jgi:hypothetical protein